jgi:hypothetical protein
MAVYSEFTNKIAEVIDSLEQSQKISGFIPARYPYTYAYDYVRSHPQAFGLAGLLSRADTSQWLDSRVGSENEKVAVCQLLAEALLREEHISSMQCSTCGATLGQRGGVWYDLYGQECAADRDHPVQAHQVIDVHPLHST